MYRSSDRHPSIRIPAYQPSITSAEMANASDAVLSQWISAYGQYLDDFQSGFADLTNNKYCVLTTTGTAAAHLAMVAAGVGPGDEVLIPALTFIATANAVAYTGATPVVCDVEFDTWNMTPETAEPFITKKTRAVFLNHLYGNPCDIEAWEAFCTDRGLLLFEDACQGLGGRFASGRVIGTGGLGASFSFFGNKPITTGQGGAFVTDQEHWYDRTRLHARQYHSGLYRHEGCVPGTNYAMTNVAAAIGLAQLERFDEMKERRDTLYKLYQQAMTEYGFKTQMLYSPYTKHSHWVFAVRVAARSVKTTDIANRMIDQGIATRPSFHPIHQQACYLDKRPRPVAETLADQILVLPGGPGMSLSQAEQVIDAFLSSV